MLLPLSKILDTPGASVSFSVCVDLSDLRFGSSFPVTEPVRAAGTVRNTAGVLILTGTVQTTLHGICDRCASEFSREFPIPSASRWCQSWPMSRTKTTPCFS